MLEAPKHDVWIQHRTSFNYFLPILRVAATTWSTWPLPPCKSSEMSSWNARALQKCHLALNFKLIVSDRCDLQKGFKPPCFNCCFPHVCSRAGMSQSRIVWNIWNQIPWVRRFEEGRGAGFPRFFATQTAAKGLHKALAVNMISYDKTLKALWCLCAVCFVIEIVSLATCITCFHGQVRHYNCDWSRSCSRFVPLGWCWLQQRQSVVPVDPKRWDVQRPVSGGHWVNWKNCM